jgi:hypothetical protein
MAAVLQAAVTVAAAAAVRVTTNTSVFFGGLVLPGLGALPCIRGPALVATPRALLRAAI